jgi:Uma2 family endonuclease
MTNTVTVPPAAIPTKPRTAAVRPGSVPPLQNGDRLTRDEFERRYKAMPGLKKAELIEGVVYMPPPISTGNHGSPQADLITWLGTYRTATPGVRVSDNSTLRLDGINEPQPDAFLYIEPEFGGRVTLDAEGYAEGATELIAEVAASSASYDLHEKLAAYRRNAVREYLVWRTYDRAITWLFLRAGRYVDLAVKKSGPGKGIYQSRVFPGLWLDAEALIRGDMPTVMRVLQQGLSAPEHAAFVAKLAKVAAKRASKPRR